jgi:hypothetical protein
MSGRKSKVRAITGDAFELLDLLVSPLYRFSEPWNGGRGAPEFYMHHVNFKTSMAHPAPVCKTR